MQGVACFEGILPVTLKLRPNQERLAEYRPRTPKQNAATQRNFLIFRLRGLYYQAFMLTGWRRKLAHWLIDRELRRHGAESETNRFAQRRAEWESSSR